MQNAGYRFRLIAIFVLLTVQAIAFERQEGECDGNRRCTTNSQEYLLELWPWPITWRMTAQPVVVAEQRVPSEASKKDERVDDYTRRSTEAAELQADFAERQYYVGIAAAIAGVLAAGFAGWAAWAACKAAGAAVAAVGSERAWIVTKPNGAIQFNYLNKCHGDNKIYNNSLMITIDFINKGRSPAIKLGVKSQYTISDYYNESAPPFLVDIPK
jgi:hypothetical protein